jgi:hypothetical protein
MIYRRCITNFLDIVGSIEDEISDESHKVAHNC